MKLKKPLQTPATLPKSPTRITGLDEITGGGLPTGPLIEGAGKARKSAEKALADAVKNEQDLRVQFYKLATDTASLVEGLVGKGHDLTTKLRGLRADLIGSQSVGSTTPPAPTPPKP